MLGLFGAPRSHSTHPVVIRHPHSDSAPGELFPLPPPRYAPGSYVWLFLLDFAQTEIDTRKAEVLNSLIMNITAKANDTNDILQTFR